MHCVLTRKPDMVIEGDFPACKLNPAHLTCTCKGFRMRALCAHVIVITALYITDAMCIGDATSYDKTYLELLCEKLSTTKPASHRPKTQWVVPTSSPMVILMSSRQRMAPPVTMRTLMSSEVAIYVHTYAYVFMLAHMRSYAFICAHMWS